MADSLGNRLTNVRKMRKLSLKRAADAAEISTAYLQKLEHGQVQTPSPNILYRLSQTLRVPYAELMKLAGYVVPKSSARRTPVGGGLLGHALRNEDLTEDEAEALTRYLDWYRHDNASGSQ